MRGKIFFALLLLFATLAVVTSLPLVQDVDTLQHVAERDSLGLDELMLAGEQASSPDLLFKRDGDAGVAAAPPSTNRELSRLLRPEALGGPTRDRLVVNTMDVLHGRLLAVKLPGRGLDAGVINRMMQQDKDFVVEGAGGKWWRFVNQGGRHFKPISLPVSDTLQGSLRTGPALATPSHALADSARSSIGSRLWARVRALFNKLPESVTAVPVRRIGKRGSELSDPPSTDREMARLLRPSALGAPVHDRLLLSTKSVLGGDYLAVQLPGKGYDAQTINAMMQQDRPFFVEGKDGKLWQFVNAGDRAFSPRAVSQPGVHFFKDSPVRSGSTHAVPTNVHKFDRGVKGTLSRAWSRIRSPFIKTKLPEAVQAVPLSKLVKRAGGDSTRILAPPATDRELARLLRAEALASPTYGQLAVRPVELLQGHFLAVKLPGNGWDAQILNHMMKQDKHFFVEGKNGRIWQFVNTGNRIFRPEAMSHSKIQFVRDALVEPTVRVPNFAYAPESTANSGLLSRFSGLLGKLPEGVEAVHVPLRKRATPEIQPRVQSVIPPPSSNYEMAQLLRPSALGIAQAKVSVKPIKLRQLGLLALKLPGGGYDSAVLNKMMQQDKDFLVEGKDGKVWRFVRDAEGVFTPRYVSSLRGLFDGPGMQKATVTTPKTVQYLPEVTPIQRVWGRVKTMFGRLPKSVQAVHLPA